MHDLNEDDGGGGGGNGNISPIRILAHFLLDVFLMHDRLWFCFNIIGHV